MTEIFWMKKFEAILLDAQVWLISQARLISQAKETHIQW